MDVECLLREHRYDHRCIVWHLRRALAVDDLPCHDQRAIPPFRDDDPKLSEQTSDHVYQLRSLPDEQTATPMHRQRCLLLARIHRDIAPRRPRDRFTDCFSLDGIVLPTHEECRVGKESITKY